MCENLKIIGWNCRRILGLDKFNRVRILMKDFKVDIVALVETRADENRVLDE